jgi:hypothetical protein
MRVVRFILTWRQQDYDLVQAAITAAEDAIKKAIQENSSTCQEANLLLAQVLFIKGVDQIIYQGRDIKGG